MRQSLLHRSGFMPVLIVLPMLLSTNPLSCGIMKSSESSAIDHRINNKVAPPVPELEINGGLLYTKIPSVPILIKEQLGDGTSIRFGNRSHSEDVSSLPALDDSCLFSDYLAADQLVAGDAVTLSYTYDLQENLSDGPLDICAQLKTSKELASDIVLYPLTYDTTAAVLSSDVANEISFDSTKSKSFTLSGKATDASGIKSLNFSLENLGTGKCLNDKKTAFQATTCPNWLVLPAAVDWSIDIVASLFEAGENYAIALNSEDLAGNLGEELDLKRFNWNLKQPISSDFTINNDATYSISRSVSLRLGSGDSTINDIRVAEGTVSEAGNVLIKLKELSAQAANGTNSQSDRDAINAEYQALRSELDRMSAVEYNGVPLLNGNSITLARSRKWPGSPETSIRIGPCNRAAILAVGRASAGR